MISAENMDRLATEISITWYCINKQKTKKGNLDLPSTNLSLDFEYIKVACCKPKHKAHK